MKVDVHFNTSIDSKPVLVNWPFTSTHSRLRWHKRPSTIVLDHQIRCKWPSSLAQDLPLLDRPFTFARLSSSRTVHFHPFGPYYRRPLDVSDRGSPSLLSPTLIERYDQPGVKDDVSLFFCWWETLLLLLWIIFFYSNAFFSKHELPSLQRMATER